jgi:hypothetical protein
MSCGRFERDELGVGQTLVAYLRDAPDGTLRDPALANDAVDARDDLHAVRQRHGARVELLQGSEA